MSATSNPPSASLTPSPSNSNSKPANNASGAPLSSSPATSALHLMAPSALMAPAPASATLNVPKSTPAKPARQTTNPEKHSAISTTNPHAGLPSGLAPSLSGLSPGVGRLGTRSPSSIPSSPASIHSSSSAIFERDIEPLGIPSLGVPLAASTSSPSYPSKPSTHAISASTSSNPHRIPRSKTTEALELTVPSVLDSAVNALSVAEESGTSITVLSPVPSQSSNPLVGSHSGSAIQSPVTMHPQSSPVGATFPPSALNNQGGIGSLGSMSGTSGGSPSPPTMSLLLQGMGMSGLMSASASVSGAPSASGRASGFASPLGSSRSPSPARSASPPAHQGADVTIPGGSPPSQTKEVLTFTSSPLKRPSLPSAAPGLGSNPNAPSPNMRASNRLSFVSYNDVLTSAPIAAQPLATVLAPGQNEPPTHLVVVDPDNGSSALGMTPTTSTGNLPLGGIGSLNVNSAADKVDVDSLGTVGLSSTGEWGREGLGGGLEERLERLWAVEREVAERGRVMTPTRVGPTSRSGSMSASTDASNAPLPPLVINPPVPASPAPAAASST